MDNPKIFELFGKKKPTREQRIALIRTQLTELESALQKEKGDQQLGHKYKEVLETVLKNVEKPDSNPQIMELLQIYQENEDRMEKILVGVQELQLYLAKMSTIADLERQVLLRLQKVLQAT